MKVLGVTRNGGMVLQTLGVYSGIVTNKADLANVPEEAAAGSKFHTAGYASLWEKGEDGEWHIVFGEDE